MFTNAPIPIPEQMQQELLRLYLTPQRFYHTIDHIKDLLTLYHELHPLWQHPTEVYLAFLYHDAVYEYGAKDNEEKSALLASEEITRHLSMHNINTDTVMQLIRHTANHGHLTAEQLNEEEQLFLDCDMSILGSTKERFQEYEQQIEQEYTQVYPRFLYRMGRKKFRNNLLKAPRIFFSSLFHERYDAQARSNLSS